MTNPSKKRGGARPGAGRPKNEPMLLPALPETNDPLVFLTAMMNDPDADSRTRLSAAQALMPYVHSKKGDNLKDVKQDAAKKASTGRFGASPPPPVRLVT